VDVRAVNGIDIYRRCCMGEEEVRSDSIEGFELPLDSIQKIVYASPADHTFRVHDS
jgi:hypothetical protein